MSGICLSRNHKKYEAIKYQDSATEEIKKEKF